MGFKCPHCFKDFGYDKVKLSEHLKNFGSCGAVADLTIKVINETTKKRKRQTEFSQLKPKKTYSHIDQNHNFRKINIVSNDDGSDNVECIHCGLKAKRYFSSLRFDGRVSYKRIEKCGYGK